MCRQTSLSTKRLITRLHYAHGDRLHRVFDCITNGAVRAPCLQKCRKVLAFQHCTHNIAPINMLFVTSISCRKLRVSFHHFYKLCVTSMNEQHVKNSTFCKLGCPKEEARSTWHYACLRIQVYVESICYLALTIISSCKPLQLNRSLKVRWLYMRHLWTHGKGRQFNDSFSALLYEQWSTVQRSSAK